MILSLGWQRPVLILTPCWSVLELWQIKLENSISTNWIFCLQKSISKLIFAGCTGSKNQVWNRLKIKFAELDFSKLIFSKIKYRSTGSKALSICTWFFEKSSLKSQVWKVSPTGFQNWFFSDYTGTLQMFTGHCGVFAGFLCGGETYW